METVRSKHNSRNVKWQVYKEGLPHMLGSSREVSSKLRISQDHLRQLANRKLVYKGVYSIKRKEK